MARAAYARGADFERRAKARLEEQGYVVFRTAGSRSAVDLIAFSARAMWSARLPLPNQSLFIQCKSGKRKISGADKLALVDLATDCGAIPVVCTRGLKFEVLSGEAKAA